jgi:hypothetical protein
MQDLILWDVPGDALVPVNAASSAGVSVAGCALAPEHACSTADQCVLYVGRRPVHSAQLQGLLGAWFAAAHARNARGDGTTLLARSARRARPAYLLRVTVPPGGIDVASEPDKSSVVSFVVDLRCFFQHLTTCLIGILCTVTHTHLEHLCTNHTPGVCRLASRRGHRHGCARARVGPAAQHDQSCAATWQWWRRGRPRRGGSNSSSSSSSSGHQWRCRRAKHSWRQQLWPRASSSRQRRVRGGARCARF